MTESTARILKEQGLFRNLSPKKWENPFPDFTLEEKVSLKLIGYARSLARVSFFKKSYRLSLSDEYLRNLWSENDEKISRSTVQRRLNELQKAGIIFISTNEPQRLPDGNWKQDREIHLIPLTPEVKKFTPCVSKKTHQKKSLSLDSDRTIQKKENHESSYIDTSSLKEITAEKKQKPDNLTRRIQISFLKKAITRIIDEDELSYRFMCLLLRKCFGANEQTIKYYGSVIHLQLRFKPEAVVSVLELMVKSYSEIRKPVGYLISEFQSILGQTNQKTISVESIQSKSSKRPQEQPRQLQSKKRNLEELEAHFTQQKIERKKERDSKLKEKEKIQNHDKEKNDSKNEFGKILSLFKKHTQ